MKINLPKTKNSHYSFFPLLILLFLLFGKQTLTAQEAVEIFTSTNDTIPKDHYKSWSLFLVSNPEWALPESNNKLRELYYRFKAFGDALGPDHLAVWFWTKDPIDEDLFKYLDVMRSSAFCSKLNLPSSKSPYVVITSEYPGNSLLSKYPESFNSLEKFSVIELNKLKAEEITQVLTSLVDPIKENDLDAIDPKTEDFWRGLQRSYENIRDTLVDICKSITMTINTTFFNIELAPCED